MSLAALLAAGAVKLERVAQDGMRVRASAGAASFRRRGTLEECLKQAARTCSGLKDQVEADPAQASRRAQAARERAQRDIEQRVTKALQRLPRSSSQAAQRRQGRRRPSLHHGCRRQRDEDGRRGLPPGFQYPVSPPIATADRRRRGVVTAGSDMAQLQPMVEQVGARCGELPAQWLVDGGYPAHEQIDAVAARPRSTRRCPSRGQRRASRATMSARQACAQARGQRRGCRAGDSA